VATLGFHWYERDRNDLEVIALKPLNRVRSIALVAGASLLLLPAPASAATVGPVITADGITCTLANAILTSNDNVNTGGCIAVGPKSIVDTIELVYDVTLTTKDPTEGDDEDEEHGPSALPEIEGHLTINAHGHTIQRDPELFSVANGGDGADPCSGAGEKFRIIHVGYPGGNLTLNDATIRNGCSDEWGGGGFLFEGHDLELNRVTVTNNRAVMGGGILTHESTTVLNDSALAGNSAVAGGGLYVRTGTVRITNSTLSGNSATGATGTVCVESLYIKSCLPQGSGGAIGLNGGTTSITDSTFIYNVAFGGGGLYNGGATAYVTRATIAANTAVNGGFLFNQHGSVAITNVTAFLNSAYSGGVAYNAGVAGTIVRHATLAQNSATTGGGVFATNKRLVTISNTLLGNPTGGNCAFAAGGSVVSAGYNRSTDATCLLTQATDQQNVADLRLGLPIDDGTPGGAYLPLLAGSPAIDKGSPDSTTSDQIGQARIGPADIGAIEYPRFVKLWLGAKTNADKTLRLDLLAEVFVDGVPVTPGQLSNVTIGGVGFANAALLTVPVPAVDAPSGSLLEIRLSARRPCVASGPASGSVRFWFNGQPVDSGPGRDAGSRAGVTAAGYTSILYLRDGFVLSTVAGPGGAADAFLDLAVNSSVPCTGPGRPFSPFGTWSMTIP
jgi:hypothetical protein